MGYRYPCEVIPQLVDVLKASSSYADAFSRLGGEHSIDSLRSVFSRHRSCCGTLAPGSYFKPSQPAGPLRIGRPRAPTPELRPLAKTQPGQGLAVLVPDVHVPYHDDRAWSLLLRVLREISPNHVIVLGDFADCYSVSFHDKSPRRASRLADEIAQVCECLRELEAAAPDSTRVYIEGNHEARLARYVARNAGALHGLPGLSLPELFDLPAHGWLWVPYHQSYRFGDLHLTHDVGRAGVHSARQSRIAFGASIGIGHVHRMTIEHERTIDGKHNIGASFGWLGDAEAVDYRHRGLARREWVHGIGIAQHDDRGHVHVQAVPFVDGRAWVAGRMIAA